MCEQKHGWRGVFLAWEGVFFADLTCHMQSAFSSLKMVKKSGKFRGQFWCEMVHNPCKGVFSWRKVKTYLEGILKPMFIYVYTNTISEQFYLPPPPCAKPCCVVPGVGIAYVIYISCELKSCHAQSDANAV